MSFNVGPRVVSATGGSIKRVGNYRIHTFPSELVTDGLVLNLDAGDPRSYPGSGTTWTDLSGYAQNGTLTNGPTYSNANGGSLVFTKAGLKYSESTASAFSITGANAKFTLEAWAKNTTDGNYNTVLSIATRYAQIGFGISGTFMYGSNGGAGNNLIFPAGHTVGNWYHLVMTFEGLGDNIAKFYVNGSLLTSGNIGNNGNTTTTSIRIGAFATSGTEFLDGNVAVARVYNRALSAAEVAQNYDALKVRYTSYTNTFTPTCGGGSGKVEVLCVAGGGGGGKGTSGGGGGGGGLLYNSAFTVNSNTGIGITVGDGGTGTTADGTQATNGGNSIFSTLTSIGGGYGGNENAGGNSSMRNGNTGGSGGGGVYNGNGSSGTTGQGNSGGNGTSGGNRWTGGGGGGAGSSGASATAYYGGDGGSGLAYSISGTSSYYAGGGGGAAQSSGGGTVYGGNGGLGGGGAGPADQTGSQVLPGVSGIPNTGGGGSGGVESASVSSGNGSNGIVIVRYPATDYNVELLVVGGGGGGGFYHAGGGGAGGLIYYSSYPVSAGTKYSVTVGAGSSTQSSWIVPASGKNSIFGQLIAFGGGDGGNYVNRYGASGGSGGGGFYSHAEGQIVPNTGGNGVLGQGNSGGNALIVSGYHGSGGGGAGSVGGVSPSGSVGGTGGAGLAFSITGTSVYYAGGGGGHGNTTVGTGGTGGGGTGGGGEGSGSAGTVNTGGGGGGGGGGAGTGGAGGSGIIIIAYQGPQRGVGGTVDTTSRPGYTIHTFTTTGTDFFIP